MNLRTTSLHVLLSALATVALTITIDSGRVLAHGGGGDVAVFETVGQTDVGFAIPNADDSERLFFDPNDSVFQSILIPAPPIVGFPEVGADEPGYDAQPGDLPIGSSLSYHVLDLFYWDGTGAVSLGSPSGVSASFPDTAVAIHSDGSFHNHPLYGLHDLTPDGNPIPDGVYIGKLSVSVTGLAESEPYYLVSLVDGELNSDADPQAAAEALGQAVRDYMADPITNPEPMYGGRSFAFYGAAIQHMESLTMVPEPSTVLLALIAAGVFGLPKRRLI